MSRNWTEKQKQAIKARRGSVLVSAAAGSGKTAVLVERVIERLTDKDNPTSADRLLIVTFTKAAAGEMRERINAAIENLLKERPDDSNLIRQQMLLPSAKICTIDSFCLSLVKENFQYLTLPADFKNADEGELQILSKQAMDMTLEKMYETDADGSFRNLVELLFRGRDDSYLAEIIEKLYKSSISFPFPERWLDELILPYENESGLCESVFGEIIFGHIEGVLEHLIETLNEILINCQSDEVLYKMYYNAVNSDLAQSFGMLEKVKERKWDEARHRVLNYVALSRGRKPTGMEEDFLMLSFKDKREYVKKTIKDLGTIMCCSEREYDEDMAELLPLLKTLITAVKTYMQFFSEHKLEKKVADFSDISHYALSLLVEETSDGYKKTEIAKAYADCFDEILIDEYQDTNAAQDMLFTAISKDNLFRVGDVKQSIYRFRQANPDIFISLKDNCEFYDSERDNYPSKIILGNNFRSRNGVTGIINFIFSQIMSRRTGDVDYNDEEKLIASAVYSEKDEPDTELHILSVEGLDKYTDSSAEAQARYIARLIKDMISQGFTVRGENGERKATYKDFSVLLRKTGSGNGLTYAEVFREFGIPCFVEVPGEFLTCMEITLALNILRIIDNPKQDIPVVSVLMSSVFGFSPDEISEIRIKGRGDCFYSRLLSLKDSGNEKIDFFLKKLSELRELSISLSVSEFIDTVYDETALIYLFDAIDPTLTKRANLLLLKEYSETYEGLGYVGLSGFIRFVDNLSDKKKDISGTAGVSTSADVVKIMTIHKSKGLEFPVCILADTAKQFNREDEKQNVVISQKHGIGIIRRNIETFEQLSTLSHTAVKLSLSRESISEELRVLYVALTRAKEKLIMVYANAKGDKTIENYAKKINLQTKTQSPYSVLKSVGYGQWLLSSLLRHPDAKLLRESAGVGEEITLPCEVPLKIVMADFDEKEEFFAEAQALASVDDDFMAFLKKQCEYRYKYEALGSVLTKRAASEVDKNFVDRDYFASGVPSFMLGDTLSGAARGIAVHTFMQYADYEKAKADPEKEIERLKNMGILTKAEASAISVEKIKRFFSSDLARRIFASSLVMREKKFTIEVPISEVYEGLEEFSDEKMMIQGIADCAFLEDGKLTVVDYKTDSLSTDEEFIEKYSSQVLVYKKALALSTGYEVGKTLLYSFHLGREIAVE